jgi:hypothetical protein
LLAVIGRGGKVMNKEFIKKIIKAEKLKYEAIKEILPNNLRERVNVFEKDAFNLLKDVALEMIKEDVKEENQVGTKSTKKVNVDFS